MIIIKEFKLINNNWLEVSWVENEKEVRCEFFGDSDEYQELLKQRCIEFGTDLNEEQLGILEEQKDNRYLPTDEEIADQNRINIITDLENKIKEVKQYLSSTDFYMTIDKYAELSDDKKLELTTKRSEARLLINTLEAELGAMQWKYS